MNLTALTLRDFTAGPSIGNQTAKAAQTLPAPTLRRCRTREQGSALITVGHAIEYLLGSRVTKAETVGDAEREALAILARANLSLYSEGAEIISVPGRLRRWFHGELSLTSKPANAAG